jgi:hypothetical protein
MNVRRMSADGGTSDRAGCGRTRGHPGGFSAASKGVAAPDVFRPLAHYLAGRVGAAAAAHLACQREAAYLPASPGPLASPTASPCRGPVTGRRRARRGARRGSRPLPRARWPLPQCWCCVPERSAAQQSAVSLPRTLAADPHPCADIRPAVAGGKEPGDLVLDGLLRGDLACDQRPQPSDVVGNHAALAGCLPCRGSRRWSRRAKSLGQDQFSTPPARRLRAALAAHGDPPLEARGAAHRRIADTPVCGHLAATMIVVTLGCQKSEVAGIDLGCHGSWSVWGPCKGVPLTRRVTERVTFVGFRLDDRGVPATGVSPGSSDGLCVPAMASPVPLAARRSGGSLPRSRPSSSCGLPVQMGSGEARSGTRTGAVAKRVHARRTPRRSGHRGTRCRPRAQARSRAVR